MLLKHRQRENAFARKVLFLALAILASLLMILFSSCQKEGIIEGNNEPELAKSRVTPEQNGVMSHGFGSYEWDMLIYDCASEETIHVVGRVTYQWKQSADKYLYNANFEGLNGIGETSGIKYHCNIHESMTLNNGITTQMIKIKLIGEGGEIFTFSSLLRYYWGPDFKQVILMDKVSQTPCETY